MQISAPYGISKIQDNILGIAENNSGLFMLRSPKITGVKYQTYRGDTLGGSGYQVPASTKLRVLGIIIFDYESGGSNVLFSLGYGDTSVSDSAAAPTTPLYETLPVMNATTTAPITANNTYIPFGGTIPAGKYPFIYNANATNSQFYSVLICRLEAV